MTTNHPHHITVTDAVQLINSLVFMPEWKWGAEDFTGRFEGGIKVHVVYEARNSNRDMAPDYSQWIEGGARADFVIQITDCFTPDDVVRKFLHEVIFVVFEHEAREFLRYPDTMVAPFHPHHLDTMLAWGTPERDKTFGVA